MRFSIYDKRNLYQNRKESLAFATISSDDAKQKSQKSLCHFFKTTRRSKSETRAAQSLRISEDTSNT